MGQARKKTSPLFPPQALEAMVEVLSQAERGTKSLSQLGQELNSLLQASQRETPALHKDELFRELMEFVELDLSDLAYSLAIHDQPALDRLRQKIAQWKERLSALLSEKPSRKTRKKDG